LGLLEQTTIVIQSVSETLRIKERKGVARAIFSPNKNVSLHRSDAKTAIFYSRVGVADATLALEAKIAQYLSISITILVNDYGSSNLIPVKHYGRN